MQQAKSEGTRWWATLACHHGKIGRDNSERILAGHPVGSYLLREKYDSDMQILSKVVAFDGKKKTFSHQTVIENWENEEDALQAAKLAIENVFDGEPVLRESNYCTTPQIPHRWNRTEEAWMPLPSSSSLSQPRKLSFHVRKLTSHLYL